MADKQKVKNRALNKTAATSEKLRQRKCLKSAHVLHSTT